MSERTAPRGKRTILGGVAAAVAAGAIAVVGGVPGILAGVALAACWYVLGPVYAFAVGQVAAVAVWDGRPLAVVAGLELAVLAVLVAPDLATRSRRRVALWSLAIAVALGGLAYGAQATWETTWATATVVLGVAALAAYGLHRYELLATGALDAAGEVRKD